MTDEPPNPALLPAGLRDLLPPDAETEASAVEALMNVFASHGYQRVKPPLLEFEDSLLAGSGAAVAEQTFRLMDPDSRRMMGLRADTTPQVARIATTRLVNAARPLRLSYAGQCLRVHGSQIVPDRQVGQAGIELIGHDSPEADAEIVLVAAEALAAVGLSRVSFDLTMPMLAPILMDDAGIEGTTRAALARALDRKDAAEVNAHGGKIATVLFKLLRASGGADRALAVLREVELGEQGGALAARLTDAVAAIRTRNPSLLLTVDPVEFRGFRYENGVSVSIFAPGKHEILGRGGRYLSGDAEPATGVTLYSDAILRAAPKRQTRARVFIPASASQARAAALRREGYATVAALSPHRDDAAEAARLGCTLVLRDGEIRPLVDETQTGD